MKKNLKGSCGSGNMWIENIYETVELFIGYVQISSDKTVTILSIIALVVCPLHTIYLQVFVKRKMWFINSELTLEGFLPTSFTQGPRKEEEVVKNENMSVFGFTS